MRHLLLSSMSVVALAILGCGSSATDFVGKWGRERESLEIFADKTWLMRKPGYEFAGSWTLLDDGRYKLSYTKSGSSRFLFAKGSDLGLSVGRSESELSLFVRPLEWEPAEPLDDNCVSEIRGSCSKQYNCAVVFLTEKSRCQGECLERVLQALEEMGASPRYLVGGEMAAAEDPFVVPRGGSAMGAECLASFLGPNYRVVSLTDERPRASAGYGYYQITLE